MWGQKIVAPKGWKIPTDTEPLKVAIPLNPPFENFLKKDPTKEFTGFCIDLFHKVREILKEDYDDMPYEFIPRNNDSYDELLMSIVNEVIKFISFADFAFQENFQFIYLFFPSYNAQHYVAKFCRRITFIF